MEDFDLPPQVVTEALEPGASVSAIARQIGIHPSQLFAWRRDARAERHYRERHSSCGGASVSGAVIEIVIGEVKGGQFVLHAKALHGNPFDGHMLGPVVADMEKLSGGEARSIHVDKGHRGQNHPHRFRVWISGRSAASRLPSGAR